MTFIGFTDQLTTLISKLAGGPSLMASEGTSLFNIEQFVSDLNISALQYLVFSQASWKWIALVLMLSTGLIFRKLFTVAFVAIEKLSDMSKSDLDDIIVNSVKQQVGWILTFALWYFFVIQLELTPGLNDFLLMILKVLISFQVIHALHALACHSSVFISAGLNKIGITVEPGLMPIITRSLRAFILIFGPLLALQNLGVNVMSLVAGLGLGGLAFALAAKDTAANLFGSLMILLDQPFKLGDWVVVGKHEGTVTEIGLRTTRVRTFYDSIISIPNSEVANTSVDNMGQRKYRRVKTTLGVTYDTSPEKIEGFLEAIKKIIEANPHTRKDYYQIVFSGFGASSLDILLYFFIEVEDWSRELVVKQNILLDIIRAAKEFEVDFAFPTSTLHIDSYTEQKSKPPEQPITELKNIANSFKAKANPSGKGVYKPIYER